MSCKAYSLLIFGQDEANIAGGKWIVRLKKGLSSKYWEDMVRALPFKSIRSSSLFLQVLTLIGNQFDARDNVNGIVISVRHNEDILAIWNQNAEDPEAKIRIQ